jgi:outer membrane protein OmpA-like peptidoglycan-associated protein
MATEYEPAKPHSIQIDSSATVQLPPRVFRARLTGMLFDRDKTFLLPRAMRGIKELKQYYDQHPTLEVLIVGHTDSTGGTEYNVRLSKERAQVISSFLKDDVDTWIACWKEGRPAGKTWGSVEDQLMLAHLAGYEGNIDGKIGPRTAEAVKRFQTEVGLPVTGKIDDATRKELVTKYMQQDETTLPEGTKITIHGAGPHHPEETGSDEESLRRNRRVEIFLSDGPIRPAPGAPNGPEYRQWVAKASETIDLADAPEDLVEIDLSLPEDLLDRLPADFTLILSGPHVKTQERTKSAGVEDGEMVRFEFRWIDKGKQVNLEAVGGGKKARLWREQVAGDLEAALQWEEELALLLAEEEEIEVAGEVTGATRIPDDLRAEELQDFLPRNS